MFVLPFQVDFRLVRLPLATILVCLLCISVFFAQRASDTRWHEAIEFSCDHDEETFHFLLALRAPGATGSQCRELATELLRAGDPQAQIEATAASWSTMPFAARIGGKEGIAQLLGTFWSGLSRLGGAAPLTPRLSYPPRSWNPWRMITAALAHDGWLHLLGNLFFFYLFGATVEAVLGSLRYLVLLVGLAIGTHTIYSLVSLGSAAPPTLGLSGVVYGVLALFAYFLPDARIRSLVVLFVRVRIVGLSAWFIALWYVGADALALLLFGNHGGVNLVAHISGAGLAWLAGASLFRDECARVREEAKPYLQPYI